MEWTDPHYRMLIRGITRKSVLYTEMVVDETIIYNPNLDVFIGKDIEEENSVVQLGGNNCESLSKAAEIIGNYPGKYSEINLNCGCPSNRVSQKCFGAKLMLNPNLVRELVYSMQRRVSIPITVKCRIGVDENDSYNELKHFIMQAHAGGAKKFIIHSRKCILDGLTTKQNRDIPPLKYEVVHNLKRDFPDISFILNGAITDLNQAKLHLDPLGYDDSHCNDERSRILPAVDGVMIGRAAYNNPLLLATVDSQFYGVSDPCLTRRQILERYMDYCDWVQSPVEGRPMKVGTGGKLRPISSSLLLNAMRNVVVGMKFSGKFKQALNDLYIERVRGTVGFYNPSPRDIIEGSMVHLDDAELDAPYGNRISDL